jgi:phage shock protein A
MSVSDTVDTQVESLRARMAALNVGQSVAEAIRLNVGSIDEAAVNTHFERMRNRINPSVARAKRSAGAEYVVENGSFLSNARALLLVFVVTRTA